MPRYVILLHEMPAAKRPTHYDVMLEWEGALRTWAIENIHCLLRGVPVPAAALADHRLHYLDYEGEVSGDRGRVTQWASGVYEIMAQSPGHLAVSLSGPQLNGTLIIQSDEQDCTVRFHPSSTAPKA